MRTCLPCLSLLLFASPCAAQIALGPADDVEGALNALSPGDEVVLADGTYELDERFSFTAVGTEAAPIVIRAADGATAHFHRPNASQNIWDVENAEHVVIRGLAFSGGSAGLRISGATSLTIEGCEIFDTADVALRMNDSGVTYADVTIRENHIHDTGGTGEGMYLGCNEDDCRIAGGLVEGNYVHHTNAGDVSQGDGIELKEGSHGVVIRDNVIHDTNYPCLLGYGTVGNGEPNVVERNVMWACGNHGIQWAADAILRNNIVLGASANGIASQPHQSESPSDLVIVHNTVLAPSNDALSVRNASGTVTVANNALYAQSGRAILVRGDASEVTVAGNVGVGSLEGVSGGFTDGDRSTDFVDARFGGGVPNDVFPAAGGGLVGAGDAAHVVSDDFNGVSRMGVADVGAYAFGDGSNPGWTLAEDFKGETETPTPGTDAGVPPTDGGTGGADAGAAPGADGGAAGRDGGPDEGEDDGCGCRSAGSGRGPTAPLALLASAALLWWRRRAP
ncbi:MAG TPA: right-handed parallel beta-helix repeat-containing protein [Sandaracinaceae bacterium LLY-WYZ-13_1]|nr:right-handed parallel beta-helix repeat-containing protein [Sandaracinaceae bacterium LLY-WYZ-13_1]